MAKAKGANGASAPATPPNQTTSADFTTLWIAGLESGLHVWRLMTDLTLEAMRAEQDIAMASCRSQITPADAPLSELETSLGARMIAPYLAIPAFWNTMTRAMLPTPEQQPSGLVD